MDATPCSVIAIPQEMFAGIQSPKLLNYIDHPISQGLNDAREQILVYATENAQPAYSTNAIVRVAEFLIARTIPSEEAKRLGSGCSGWWSIGSLLHGARCRSGANGEDCAG
jgi:hypothetical protein